MDPKCPDGYPTIATTSSCITQESLNEIKASRKRRNLLPAEMELGMKIIQEADIGSPMDME